jgi:hypothetical protein
VAAAAAHGIFCSLLFFAGDVFGAGWGVGSGCCIGAGGSIGAGCSVDSSGLVSIRAADFSCFYGVEGVSFIYLLLCEGRGIISVLDDVLLVRVADEAGNYGSTDRASTLGSVAPHSFFLSHLCRTVGRCSFIMYDSPWRVAGVMDFAASPKFGSAWLGGRWIWFLAVGLLQRRVMAPSMECAWGGGSTCVISFVCSEVLVAKCWDEFVTVLCHLFNGSPSKKRLERDVSAPLLLTKSRRLSLAPHCRCHAPRRAPVPSSRSVGNSHNASTSGRPDGTPSRTFPTPRRAPECAAADWVRRVHVKRWTTSRCVYEFVR